MSKQQLIFDPNLANYLTDHDIVGNIQIDKDGNVITAGNGSSDNVASTFNGIDTRGFLFGYDSVGGNWDRLQSTNGSLNVNLTSPISVSVDLDQTDEITVFQGTDPWIVSATDFDIRNLTFATDSVDVSGSSVSISNAVTVSATDLDIRNLSSAQDSVSVLDIVSTIENTATVIGDLASAAIVASALANRKSAWLFNNSKATMYIGKSGVTSANGMPLTGKSLYELNVGPAAVVHAIGSEAGMDLRVVELA